MVLLVSIQLQVIWFALHLVQACITKKKNTCSCLPLLLICSFFYLALPYFSYERSLSSFHIFPNWFELWHLQLRDNYVHLFTGSPHFCLVTAYFMLLDVHASHFVVLAYYKFFVQVVHVPLNNLIFLFVLYMLFNPFFATYCYIAC